GAMRSALESVHFYRRVPSDLTKGTPTGGLLSLFAAAVMAWLFCADLALFFKVHWAHEVRLDQVYDQAIRVNMNITMLRMPCRFVSVDIFDVMGASVLNVSSGIHRERVLSSGKRLKYS
ncbi:endoplasmic reticulum-golgi intermediate compartment-domain-containing protein, partial [Pavlovales sp. CCMP2436]